MIYGITSLLSTSRQSLEQSDTGRSEYIVSQFIQKPPGEKETKEDGLLHGLTTGPLDLTCHTVANVLRSVSYFPPGKHFAAVCHRGPDSVLCHL